MTLGGWSSLPGLDCPSFFFSLSSSHLTVLLREQGRKAHRGRGMGEERLVVLCVGRDGPRCGNEMLIVLPRGKRERRKRRCGRDEEQ